MTLKDVFIGTIGSLSDLRAKYKDTIASLKADTKYSAEYQAEMIQEARAAFAREADSIAAGARERANAARAAHKKHQDGLATRRLSPERAQAFNTAIAMMQFAGKALSAQDIAELAGGFADDPIALAAFRGLADREGLNGAEIPVALSQNPDDALSMGLGIIHKAATTPPDVDLGLELPISVAHFKQLPASALEAPGEQ